MFAVLVCLSLLHSISTADPQSDANKLQFIEDKVELLSSSSSSEKPQAKEVDDLLKHVSKSTPIDDTVLLFENGKDEDELLTPSESIVFRPLFSYRKTQSKRNKIKNSKKPPSNPNTIRRRVYTYTPPKYVSEYPKHYYSNSYQYYPNPYYHPPVYYPSNRYYYSPYY